MLIIGENINGTIPSAKKAILERDNTFIIESAKRQAEAGADIIDINVGTGEGTAEDEIRSMKWAVELVMDAVECRLCIDSDNPEVLEAGLTAAGPRAGIINSVKGSESSLNKVLPMARDLALPVIGLTMDDSGIPKSAEERVAIAGRIIEKASSEGIPHENIYIDPLVMPVSTDISQGAVTLETVRRLKTEFRGVRNVLAVSNVSFGLPKRSLINGSLISMASYLGADAVIINPLHRSLIAAVLAANTLLGRDRHCRKYTRAARKETI